MRTERETEPSRRPLFGWVKMAKHDSSLWLALSHCSNDISAVQFRRASVKCVCVDDWFLFYGLASRELVIRRNKSALFDLSVNSNKTHFTAARTHAHTPADTCTCSYRVIAAHKKTTFIRTQGVHSVSPANENPGCFPVFTHYTAHPLYALCNSLQWDKSLFVWHLVFLLLYSMLCVLIFKLLW